MISVIVPVYTVEPYLRRCIDSILSQTYRDMEVILVDDASPDNSGEICDEYANADKRIRVIHLSENRGLSAARNAGLEEANGEYIGFVDSDDWIEPDMYECLLRELQIGAADIAVCGYFIEKKRSVSKTLMYARYVGTDSLKAILSGKINNNVWNKLYRKKLFESIRFPEGRNSEDIAIMHRILYESRECIVIADHKYHYRRREGSISKTHTAQNLFDFSNSYFDRYYFCMERSSECNIPECLVLTAAATGISKVWRWWHGCTNEEKRKYREQIAELKKFSNCHIAIFGKQTWPIYLRLSSVFMHSDSVFSFSVLYYINQWCRILFG